MTKKGHRLQEGLLPPKQPRAKPLHQRYGHVLDATVDEILPSGRRPAPVDEPSGPADHLLKKSELYKSLETLFFAALARAGSLNSDEDEPLAVLAAEANLTLSEFETVAMTVDGHRREQIAKWQHISVDAVDSARRRGVQKLREYVLNSASTVFSASVLRGFEGGDET